MYFHSSKYIINFLIQTLKNQNEILNEYFNNTTIDTLYPKKGIRWTWSSNRMVTMLALLMKGGLWYFNNISYRGCQFYWWRKPEYPEETGVSWENHCPVASHWQTLSYNVVSSTLHLSGIQTLNVSGNSHWLHM